MSKRSPTGYLVAGIIWIVIIGVLAVAAKYFVVPYFKKNLANRTGSEPRHYDHTVVVNADSFSGYSVLRSSELRDDLRGQSIDLRIQDDGADYPARMKALRDRDIQMAVFTVDSFVLAGAKLGEYPATIVLVIDETKGADAIVAYKDAVGSIQDLDRPDARFVLTPQSPSEFLARTVIADFSLPNIPDQWWIEADGAEDVFRQFRRASKTEKRAYVLWEPYVSKSLEISGAHLLMDSSKLKSIIVDVLVAERNYLSEHGDLVRKVIEAYLRANYEQNRKPNGMQALVREDAQNNGAERLTAAQAEKLVGGIEWKNTQENYAHFGLLPSGETHGLMYLGDIITNIANILSKTGAVSGNPVEGKSHTLFYDRTLREMQAAGFHPGKKLNIIANANLTPEQVRAAAALPALTDQQWDALNEVAKVRIPPISFARGTNRLNLQSTRYLDELCGKLPTWPRYYLRVTGHARAEGDPAANRRLAQDRASATVEYILSKGIDKNRVQSDAATPSARGGEAQSVSFMLLEEPY